MSTDNSSSSETGQQKGPTLHVGELIDLAYEIAKDQFKDQFFSFTTIWSRVWKAAERFPRNNVSSWIGYFYTELITDPRFLIYGFNNIVLKEFITHSELKKMEKVVFSDENVFEEEYEAYVNSVKNKNKDVEMVVTEGNSGADMPVTEDENMDDEGSEENKDEIFESEEE